MRLLLLSVSTQYSGQWFGVWAGQAAYAAPDPLAIAFDKYLIFMSCGRITPASSDTLLM